MTARSRRAAWLLAVVLACRTGSDPAEPHESAAPLVRRALADTSFAWRSTATTHFHLHWPARSHTNADPTRAARELETRRAEVLGRLAEPDDALGRIEVFFVETPEQMTRLVGRPTGGWTDAPANAVLLRHAAEGEPPYRHELGHFYSHRLWGPPFSDFASEGVAVFAVGGCAGRGLHAWAALLEREGMLPPLDSLERSFDFTKAAPHLQAGSFVEYLAETHGLDAVRTLWREGLAATGRATGGDAAALEAGWRRHVARPGFQPPAGDRPSVTGRIRCE